MSKKTKTDDEVKSEPAAAAAAAAAATPTQPTTVVGEGAVAAATFDANDLETLNSAMAIVGAVGKRLVKTKLSRLKDKIRPLVAAN